jgi:hypothetical protein
MIKTQITWDTGFPSEEDIDEINTILQTLIADGKTTGQYTESVNPENPQQRIIERLWVDSESANEAIALSLQFNPVSAKIVD